MDEDQHIISNEQSNSIISFRIDRAAPPVDTANIQWKFSSSFTNDLYNTVDITNLVGGTNSVYTYTVDKLTLNISNISQSDEGRYFLIASNPAGIDYSYIDIIVHGKSVNY